MYSPHNKYAILGSAQQVSNQCDESDQNALRLLTERSPLSSIVKWTVDDCAQCCAEMNSVIPCEVEIVAPHIYLLPSKF
jgi:hypothetical protein